MLWHYVIWWISPKAKHFRGLEAVVVIHAVWIPSLLSLQWNALLGPVLRLWRSYSWWLYPITIICIQNLIYHFDYVQFWITSKCVFLFSSFSLLTVMLTLTSKPFVVCLSRILNIFISKTPPRLRLLSRQTPCFLMPWVLEFGFL